MFCANSAGRSLTQSMPSLTRPTAFVTRRLPEAVEQRASEMFCCVHNPADAVVSADALAGLAQGCDYILTSAMQPMPRSLFAQLRGTLKAVGTLSVAFNHIDIDAARESGVAVFYSPGVLSDACADLAMMLLLNATRRAHEADALMRAGAWMGYAPTQMLGLGLSGRRAGILGLGRIGQALATRLRAFGVAIHYHNRSRLPLAEEQGARYHATAEALLACSDFLFLLTPGNPEMAGFLNGRRIDLLPSQAVVVNISRGDVVDDDALIEALGSGRVYAAGLDVFRGEPNFDPRYRALRNVFLTPHIASATEDTRNAMGFLVLDGIEAFQTGRKAANQLC